MSKVRVLNNHEEVSCTILVVDDDAAMRSLLVDELSDNGCKVVESVDGNDAIGKLFTCTPDLVVTDLKMPGGGFEYLQKLRNAVQNSPIILMTAYGNSQTKKKAMAYGIAAYFEKPVRVRDLKAVLQGVCPLNQSQSCQNSPL